jgi:hypothetical protein
MRDELAPRLHRLEVAVDNVLISERAIRCHLKPGFPPFLAIGETGRLEPMPSTVGLRHFGVGPLFDLWNACRAVEWLWFVWTGEPSRDAPPPIPIPDNPETNHAGTAAAAATPAPAAVDPDAAASAARADPPGVTTD